MSKDSCKPDILQLSQGPTSTASTLSQWLHSVAMMSAQDMEACLILGGVLVHNVASNGEPEAALQARLLLWSIGCGACQCHVKAESQQHRILHHAQLHAVNLLCNGRTRLICGVQLLP